MNYDLNKYVSSDTSISHSKNGRYRKSRKLKKLRFLLKVFILSLMIAELFNVFSTYGTPLKKDIPVETPPDNSLIIQDDQVLDVETSEPVLEQPEEEENKGTYTASGMVPKSEAVDTSYFDDAVFIGDSRTEGLIFSTGLSNATAYTRKGLMVDTVIYQPSGKYGRQKNICYGGIGKNFFF